MWTRSAKQSDGTFNATVYAEGEIYEHREGFTSAREAEKWAEQKQREVLFGKPEPCDMTIDEILAELEL